MGVRKPTTTIDLSALSEAEPRGRSSAAVRRRVRIQTDRSQDARARSNGAAQAATAPDAPPQAMAREVIFDVQDVSASYGAAVALAGVTFQIYSNLITAIIEPSGCGKSTFIRSLNRMNDSVPGFALSGRILYHGYDLYGPGVDRVEG